ncbi:hypothetical protein B9Z55_000014 [Caenorhabditis nigoni]|uniref:F-box associated domain-containing protein n=1 Tax=Caenorhabditis nigoni TaxID=1611254 RepID=A0A2G5VFI0_9PELO|nr:hypothetical protein B9Z55_000014 [Caenorhabditis nigoni]
MKKLIKSSQIKRFKSINSIVYDNSHVLDAFGANPPWVYIPNRCKTDTIMFFHDYRKHDNNCFSLILHENTVEFKICDLTFRPAALCHPWEPVLESIHNYFLDLFGSSVEYRWITSSDIYLSRLPNPQPELFVPQLRNLSECRISFHKVADAKRVGNYFSSSPVFKHIDLHGVHLPVEYENELLAVREEYTPEKLFPPESKLYLAESVRIEQREMNAPAILNHFQGRQAIVKCVIFRSLHFIEFINRWKSGRAFQKLEFLQIEKIDANGLDFPQVLDRIGVKYIDATKTPPAHTLPKIHLEFHGDNPNTSPLISHAYIVRKSDNRVASVLIQGRWFKFGVWNKTEEEFLRMVE